MKKAAVRAAIGVVASAAITGGLVATANPASAWCREVAHPYYGGASVCASFVNDCVDAAVYVRVIGEEAQYTADAKCLP